MRRDRSEDERRREVEGWRASRQGADAYARGKDYSAWSLRQWAKALKSRDLVVAPPRFVRLEVATPAKAELVVEIGSARIRVTSGFDRALLRDVVAALGAV